MPPPPTFVGTAADDAVFLTGATCTVGPYATDGTLCGSPAVTAFNGHDGATYFECAHHAS